MTTSLDVRFGEWRDVRPAIAPLDPWQAVGGRSAAALLVAAMANRSSLQLTKPISRYQAKDFFERTLKIGGLSWLVGTPPTNGLVFCEQSILSDGVFYDYLELAYIQPNSSQENGFRHRLRLMPQDGALIRELLESGADPDDVRILEMRRESLILKLERVGKPMLKKRLIGEQLLVEGWLKERMILVGTV